MTETVVNDPPPFFAKEKRDVQLTDILLIVSTNLPRIKGFIGCNASVRKKVLFDEMFKMVVLWMKNEGNLSTATESLGFNNKTIVIFPIVLFNHLPPTGPINDNFT